MERFDASLELPRSSSSFGTALLRPPSPSITTAKSTDKNSPIYDVSFDLKQDHLNENAVEKLRLRVKNEFSLKVLLRTYGTIGFVAYWLLLKPELKNVKYGLLRLIWPSLLYHLTTLATSICAFLPFLVVQSQDAQEIANVNVSFTSALLLIVPFNLVIMRYLFMFGTVQNSLPAMYQLSRALGIVNSPRIVLVVLFVIIGTFVTLGTCFLWFAFKNTGQPLPHTRILGYSEDTPETNALFLIFVMLSLFFMSTEFLLATIVSSSVFKYLATFLSKTSIELVILLPRLRDGRIATSGSFRDINLDELVAQSFDDRIRIEDLHAVLVRVRRAVRIFVNHTKVGFTWSLFANTIIAGFLLYDLIAVNTQTNKFFMYNTDNRLFSVVGSIFCFLLAFNVATTAFSCAKLTDLSEKFELRFLEVLNSLNHPSKLRIVQYLTLFPKPVRFVITGVAINFALLAKLSYTFLTIGLVLLQRYVFA